MTSNPHPSYRPDIDGLRAVAVLAVVVFHYFQNLLTGGFVGVDIFFVISGFLISSIIFAGLKRDAFSFKEFYARRIRRIFPALATVLFACMVFGWFALAADEYMQLGKHTAAGAAFISNFIFWAEAGYFDTAAELKPLLHLWSLGVEEQFYIVWPLLLFVAHRRGFNLLRVTIVVAVVSFLLNVGGIKSHPAAAFYQPEARFWELLLGSGLAYIKLQKKAQFDAVLSGTAIRVYRYEVSLGNVLAVIGALLIAVAIIVIDRTKVFPGWWALLPALGALLILSAGPAAWINRKILAHRALVFIGLISYPLYLWHWPLLSFARMIESQTPTEEIRLAGVVLSILLAWLTYRLVEKPVRASRKIAVVYVLVALISILGITGLVIQKNRGLSNRFPAEVRKLMDYSYSFESDYRLGECFLGGDQSADAFAEKCLGGMDVRSKKVFLWGDSHAAHLYPGLRYFEENGVFQLAQYTAGSCPPVIGVSIAVRPRCTEINRDILELIRRTKPDTVILAGNWSLYNGTGGWGKIDPARVADSISELKRIGIKNIVVFGPVPIWKESLPKTLVKLARHNNWREPPSRSTYGLVDAVKDVDRRLGRLASDAGVTYVSPLSAFCNAQGCLTKVDHDLTAWDSGHLTKAASIFLIRSNLEKILGKP